MTRLGRTGHGTGPRKVKVTNTPQYSRDMTKAGWEVEEYGRF